MGQPGKEGTWGRMDTCVYMAESLYCLPETTTTLLTGYTSIPNKKFKEKKKNWTWASLVTWTGKNLPVTQETRVRSLGLKDPLEKRMPTYSSIFNWRIPWKEEPGGL